tara:strand:+ start:6531 stop:6737 length:207 start_codon:yes stop_codon:yes gene_type:complete
MCPPAPSQIKGYLRDGAPNFRGLRVIINRLTEVKGIVRDLDALDEMNYMLQPGAGRIGTLALQAFASE